METYLNSMLAGSGMNIVSAAYLVCLFGTAVFRPSCIKKKVLFRMACTIYAMSFVIPVLPNLLAASGISEYMVRSRSVSIIASSGALLLGLSMILVFASLTLEEKSAS